MTQTQTTSGEQASPRGALLLDHARIDTLLTRLADQAEGNAQAELDQTWTELERAVLRHMEAEERELFPALAQEAPSEQQALAADHASFRRSLAEIGVGIQLHAVPLHVVRELATKIREHAEREDRFLYAWAEKSSAPGPRAFIQRIREARGRLEDVLGKISGP